MVSVLAFPSTASTKKWPGKISVSLVNYTPQLDDISTVLSRNNLFGEIKLAPCGFGVSRIEPLGLLLHVV